MKVFIIIFLLAIVVCATAEYSTSDNSHTANQIVIDVPTEETAHAQPAVTGCGCIDPAVKSAYNVTLNPVCLIPFIGNAACNSACVNAGATGGFCDVKLDCMCYKTG